MPSGRSALSCALPDTNSTSAGCSRISICRRSGLSLRSLQTSGIARRFRHGPFRSLRIVIRGLSSFLAVRRELLSSGRSTGPAFAGSLFVPLRLVPSSTKFSGPPASSRRT